MRVQFTKMHGLGNDFLVVDAISQQVSLHPSQVAKLSNRNTGIGFDQLLLIEPPSRPDADFNYRIFNSDGFEADHCGNGARCFAKFVKDRGLTEKSVMTVNTVKGLIELELIQANEVRVNMGSPNLDPNSLPYLGLPHPKNQSVLLETHAGQLQFGLISMGNPHAVTLVDDLDQTEVSEIGRAIQAAPQFPESVNVGFLKIESRTFVRLRVFERGAGETLACGTGACAAVAFAYTQRLVDESVTVATTGGNLQISWQGPGSDLVMIGPAESVFEGEFQL
jgi:diaminopimelate epimerase